MAEKILATSCYDRGRGCLDWYLRCAEECNQPYGIVTYDLNVAQRAPKIQTTDQPEYDDLFVLFRAFHIIICLLRAIGRVVADSGGPEMLVESGVLASGSLKGFLECANYNRCKRLHPMLALAFHKLHFPEFLGACEHKDVVIAVIKDATMDSAASIDQLLAADIFDRLFDVPDIHRKNCCR